MRAPLGDRNFEALELLLRRGVVDERSLLERKSPILRWVIKIGDERSRIIARPGSTVRPRIRIGDRRVVDAGRAQVIRDLVDVEGVRIDTGHPGGEAQPELPLNGE